MGVLFALLLIVAGVLGAAALIIKNKPDARELIGKLVPFQGIIGIVLLIFSFIWLIQALQFLGIMLRYATFSGLLLLLTILVGLALGFLLGYGLINQYVLSKNVGAAAGGAGVQAKLASYQGPLGIAAILLGLWLLINVISSPFGVY
ncbi:MAG TPA: hypothetical protein VN256_18425 [Pyrinomonadaceae bacterium]|nr:hypothetical protein [Pyrinomonadaceae bacterium]